MLSLTRRNKILEILKKEKQVTTQNLEERLNVSGATIRNDLNDLEKEGFLKRIHGGAVLPDSSDSQSYKNFHHRSQKNVFEKKLLGKESSKLIEEGKSIILDASSTILFMIPHLKNKERLTIITNGLYTALEVKEISNANIIVVGGIVRPKSGALEGLLGESILDKVNADIMFTSAHGFTIEDGLTDFNYYEIQLKKKMMQKAKKVVALLDHTKIGNVSTAQFATIEEIDLIITDNKTPSNIIRSIEKLEVQVVVAE
ncbi:DeoR family transcriptional regulator [Iocasia frigidifontis]|uniref:DeoR family transcriptional regulator n=1 Tax=Iocasia fonsfrigidae TaxID=2682810 RepID=A0A8A7KDQ3_9FIRM|nr:DeoR/GlpR transcriptional regulator [Halocella sp. SP3-1]QTL99551.1 DeoR family transcriptional regulator [Iocasia fonsfrigidae]